MGFSIECLGASREVGRSAFMIHTDKHIITDYGIKIFDESGHPVYPMETETIPDFAILSHAHLDHSGCLPFLYKNHNIRWYATPPTKDICELLWQDSIKISEGLPYSPAHFNKAMRSFFPMLYGQITQFGETKIKMYDAGHIAGSAMVEMEYKDKVLLYTGDFKIQETYMHKGAKTIEDVDVLMIESTYAKKDHPPRKETEAKFMEEIEETIDNGGNVVLPAFALGRTQELISVIREHNRDVPIFVDGMGREMAKIYVRHGKYIKDSNKFLKQLRSVNLITSPADRRTATKQPGVIISSAGMMNGGPVLNYLFNVNSESKVIFTGYCVKDTNGWKLQNGGYITKDGQDLHVDLPVEYLDFSAHAGRSDILNFIKDADPKKIVLVHGEKTEEFAKELNEDHGYDAVAPMMGDREDFG